MKLYSYWRSTTSYRVRIALNLKGLAFETQAINLVDGAHRRADYAVISPGKGVPALELPDGTFLSQSMAILEWLDETHPQPPLLPGDAAARARIRAAALSIATDIHPVNNLRVINRLKAMGHGADEAVSWMNAWMKEGFEAFHAMIEPDAPFCFGHQPTLADLCLVPQLYNAHRWGCDLTPFSRLTEIEKRCLSLAAFDAARPENQPDAGVVT